MTKLKGIIYTPVCKVKDNPTPGKTKGPSFLLESRDKEYVFSLADPTVPDADNYLLSWRNSLEYVIERGAAFRVCWPALSVRHIVIINLRSL
jgi:hypothetical protein